jgi:hypothetical protein
MSDTAAHLVDRVLSDVPMRQWVLSVPYPLRLGLAYDATLLRDVLGICTRALMRSSQRRAATQLGVHGGDGPRCGRVRGDGSDVRVPHRAACTIRKRHVGSTARVDRGSCSRIAFHVLRLGRRG